MKLMDRMVIKDLKLNKRRTIVTIVGIVLAVAMLAALSTLVLSFRNSLIEYEKGKKGDFHIRFNSLTMEQAEELDRNVCLEDVHYVETIGYAALDGCANDSKPYAFVMAADSDAMEGLRFNLIEGRFPENDSEIMIPRHLKTNGRISYSVGDTITLNIGTRVYAETGEILTQGASFLGTESESITDVQTKTYTVVGICERPGTTVEDYSAPGYTFVTYIDTDAAKTGTIDVYARFTGSALRNYLDVLANIIGCNSSDLKLMYENSGSFPDNIEEIMNRLSEAMTASPYGDFTLNQYLIQYERLWPLDNTMEAVAVLGIIVAVIIVFTSVYCIKNSFEISVSEKIRQYGMLSGIGATKKQIKGSVHREAAVMGLIGIPVGALFGLLAAFILIKTSNTLLSGALSFSLIYSVSWVAVLATVLLGILTIYLSASHGATKASKVSPIEAIRNSAEIKNTAKQLKTPKLVSKFWGIGGTIAYKNIKRNRKKYKTTVISIAICTATFVAISYFMSIMTDMVSVYVSDDDCNLYAYMYYDADTDKILQDVSGLNGVTELSVIKAKAVYIDKEDYSDEYVKAFYVGSGSHVLNIYSLDADSFKKYVSEIGAGDIVGKAILVNSGTSSDAGTVKAFDCGAGDSFTFYLEDYENAVWNDEMQCYDADTIVKYEDSVEIGAVTDVRPFGKKSNTEPMLIVEESVLNSILPDVSEIRDTRICFATTDADGNQDSLEKIFEADGVTYSSTVTINNVDKSVKEQHSMLTLVAIFEYGFITVIALIGATNTINTLGTSMELRAREFAMLRSVGMTSGQFEKMVRLESLFTSAKSLLWGIAIGTGISLIIWKVEAAIDMEFAYKLPAKAMIISIVAVLVLVYCIIRISLARINKRNIIETIKNENL